MNVRTRAKWKNRLIIATTAPIAFVVLIGCGEIAENLLEEGLEEAIERDSGEEVELDFNASDGEFSVTGADGEEFSINLDEEDGEVTIVASDSESDEDITINMSEEDGGLVITGENLDDGEDVSISISEIDGQVVLDGESTSGEAIQIEGGAAIPDAWPSEIPVPTGELITASSFGGDEGQVLSVIVEIDDAVAAHDEYVERLEDAGFTVDGTSTTADGDETVAFTSLSSAEWTGLVRGGTGDGQLIVSFQSEPVD